MTLLRAVFGVLDEVGGGVVEFFQSGRGDVDHVAGLEELVVDVALERLRNLQVLVFVGRAEVGAAEVVVAAHEQDFEFGIALHGHGEVGHDVDAGVVPALLRPGRVRACPS